MSTAAPVDAPGALPYDDHPPIDPAIRARTNSLVLRYFWTATLFLLIAGLLGLFLRMNQAEMIALDSNLYYALMTAHGLGAFVAWAGFFLMGLSFWLLMRMGFPLRSFAWAEAAYWTMVAGVAGIVVTTLIGGFAASWVFLYPLPFYSAGEWSDTIIGLFSAAVLFSGVSIIVWCIAILHTVTGPAVSAERPTFGQRLGLSLGLGRLWPRRFRHAERQLPYPVVPLTVVAINMLIATLPFAALLVVQIIQSFDNSVGVDAQLAKNLLWAFGHPVVYLLLFPAAAALYYLIPRYARRPLVAGRIVIAAWLIALSANFVVWAHHIYLDYPQGSVQRVLNTAMEPTTFSLTLPSALSLYSLGATIYRSNFVWNTASGFLVAGIVGWLSAGFSGVVNATIQFNRVVHNTLWVVGHFHHMALLAIGMVIFGLMYAALPQIMHRPLFSERLGQTHLWGTLIGGYGWVCCWLLQGLEGAPRRVDVLPGNYDLATYVSIPFMFVLAAAQLVGVYNLIQTARQSPFAVPAPRPATPPEVEPGAAPAR